MVVETSGTARMLMQGGFGAIVFESRIVFLSVQTLAPT